MSFEQARTAWVNPYRAKIGEFPGKIFCFDDFSSDHAGVIRTLRRHSTVYCEIGSGSGRHAIALAAAEPSAAVFGFELRYKRAVRTIEKAESAGVENVFVLRTRGEELDGIFPAASIRGLFINFPDPWLKLKRRKHRILRPELLEQAASVLQPGGFLSFKTDQAEYFSEFVEAAHGDKRFSCEARTTDLYQSPCVEGNIPTEFEALFVRQRLPICYARYRLQS